MSAIHLLSNGGECKCDLLQPILIEF